MFDTYTPFVFTARDLPDACRLPCLRCHYKLESNNLLATGCSSDVFESPRKLKKTDDVTKFDCGKPSLNEWLRKYAWQNQQGGTSVTYVVVKDRKVVAYYSLATGSLAPSDATERVAQGVGNLPVPILLLARLAVDESLHGMGLGYNLLQDVLARTVAVAEQIGIRALVVDALDNEAKRFYENFGFQPSPIDGMTLMLLMKDIRKSIGT
jgi:GNAT superfamily N-acetyltransferase